MITYIALESRNRAKRSLHSIENENGTEIENSLSAENGNENKVPYFKYKNKNAVSRNARKLSARVRLTVSKLIRTQRICH